MHLIYVSSSLEGREIVQEGEVRLLQMKLLDNGCPAIFSDADGMAVRVAVQPQERNTMYSRLCGLVAGKGLLCDWANGRSAD